jgi:NAD(P)-dependent dehydrogenase (short-subunit alcohol dehydrogenase family)
MKKQIVITGANSGIGKSASLLFAQEGHSVVMACRNIEKSESVQNEIVKSTGNNHVELMQLDVSSFHSIHTFCDQFNKKFEKLDVLIHNAAYFNHGSPYKLSENDIELTFATNLVGPFLMTMKLHDLLKKSGDPRVLMAGSNIIKHFFNPKLSVDLSNLKGENPDDPNFKVYNQYRDSKMALFMITRRFAEYFQPDGIKVNMLQINGATMSEEALQKVTPGYRMIARIQNLFFRPPEFMAKHYFDICTIDKFKDVSGKLINHKQEIMQPAKEQPGIADQVRQLTGAGFYPYYADDRLEQDAIWNFCMNAAGVKSMGG